MLLAGFFSNLSESSNSDEKTYCVNGPYTSTEVGPTMSTQIIYMYKFLFLFQSPNTQPIVKRESNVPSNGNDKINKPMDKKQVSVRL